MTVVTVYNLTVTLSIYYYLLSLKLLPLALIIDSNGRKEIYYPKNHPGKYR